MSINEVFAEFDGQQCAECGDHFDHRQSNYSAVWSDQHDNLICVHCNEQPKH
ncbi:MAG: hypothetical protein ACO395_04765 [Pontimonas sp.]